MSKDKNQKKDKALQKLGKKEADKKQRKFEEARKSRVSRMAGNIASGMVTGCNPDNDMQAATRAVALAFRIDTIIYGGSDDE